MLTPMRARSGLAPRPPRRSEVRPAPETAAAAEALETTRARPGGDFPVPPLPASRLSGYTPKVAADICDYVASGVPVMHATQAAAGIPVETWYGWLRSVPGLKEKHDQAMSRSVAFRVLEIMKAGASDWRAHKWYLSVVHHETFGDKDKLTIGGNVEISLDTREKASAAIAAALAAGGPEAARAVEDALGVSLVPQALPDASPLAGFGAADAPRLVVDAETEAP